ncbi:MAG TPA: hypothetical protein VIQ54_04175 [Polyangia bacterium]
MNADATGEQVRRFRDESQRRVERDARWQTFVAWCAVATLGSGIALAALNAHDARTAREADGHAQAGDRH